MSVLKFFRAFICTVMVWWCLGCFGGDLGYFEAVGFQKRNLAHYMYADALVGFGMVLGGYGCFNRPHDGYANRSNSKTSLPTDSRTVLPRAVG